MGTHRVDRTNAFRSERYRKRKQSEGYRMQGFLLPPDVVTGLDALASVEGVSKSQVVCRLIRAALNEGDVI